MSSLGDGGHLLLGDVVHRVAGERNQVPRHPTTHLCRAASSGRILALATNASIGCSGGPPTDLNTWAAMAVISS